MKPHIFNFIFLNQTHTPNPKGPIIHSFFAFLTVCCYIKPFNMHNENDCISNFCKIVKLVLEIQRNTLNTVMFLLLICIIFCSAIIFQMKIMVLQQKYGKVWYVVNLKSSFHLWWYIDQSTSSYTLVQCCLHQYTLGVLGSSSTSVL